MLRWLGWWKTKLAADRRPAEGRAAERRDDGAGAQGVPQGVPQAVTVQDLARLEALIEARFKAVEQRIDANAEAHLIVSMEAMAEVVRRYTGGKPKGLLLPPVKAAPNGAADG